MLPCPPTPLGRETHAWTKELKRSESDLQAAEDLLTQIQRGARFRQAQPAAATTTPPATAAAAAAAQGGGAGRSFSALLRRTKVDLGEVTIL